MLRNRLSTGGFLSGVGFVAIWLSALAAGLGGGLILGVVSRASERVIGPFTVLAFAALDNLTKGSSGQALQNANLMLGLEETEGLMMAPLFP